MSEATPEKEPFNLQQYGDEMLEKMQQPGAMEAVDKVFRRDLTEIVQDGSLKAELDEAVDDPDLEVGNEF